jgi:hypothetical protein
LRPSSLVAQRDHDGVEKFRVNRPVDFTLDDAATAMHAVVDRDLARRGARTTVGRSRVPVALRQIARHGWPADFTPDPARVAFWRAWLLDNQVFTDASSPEENRTT